ncbi:hypothetical protein [Chitinophaga sp. sic0106]|uniref:hypothetical protein n=1 Tax=Chitinophaga sp. sic0106 TaxID=2854785 RepID=UPI001C44B7D8|nr:hypothetical protein [Chitinophaga sp. sic0106]MBV7529896.1 hypothetical protein [Chitinophaga sp. sic0106]
MIYHLPYLRKILFTLLLLNFSVTALCQITPFAIIKDSDGYTNIRSEKSKAVIDTLFRDQVFAISPGEDEKDKWISIDYPHYKPASTAFVRSSNSISGLIHATRIQRLSDLPQWEKRVTDTALLLRKGTSVVTIRIGKFLADKHKITKSEGFVSKIDNEVPWGIDGYISEAVTEIKSITVDRNGAAFVFPATAVKNMLNPTKLKDFFGIAEGDGGTLYLFMSNSDGAGSYEVVWTIKGKAVVNQFLYINF